MKYKQHKKQELSNTKSVNQISLPLSFNYFYDIVVLRQMFFYNLYNKK